MQGAEKHSVGLTAVGLVVAVFVFAAVWVLGGIAFWFFDNFRGLGDDKYQAIFRVLAVPGIGGYAAMTAVRSWLPRANVRIVFFGFSALALIAAAVYIAYVGPVMGNIGISKLEFLLGIIELFPAVLGAHIGAK